MDKENIKLPKFFKIYLLVLLALAVILINPFSREKIFGSLNLFNNPEKELKLVKEFPIDPAIKKVEISNDKIIQWKRNKLSFLDFNGFESFKKDFKFKDPDIVLGAETIYIMDKSSGNLYLLSYEGETIERINLKAPFNRLKEDGENIYIYKKDGEKEIVDIIDKKGTLLKTHEERIPILTVSMGNKDREFLVSTLEVDKDLKSAINIYSMDGSEIGSLKLKDEIVVYSEFIKDKVLIATDRKLYYLENGEVNWEKKYEDLKDIKVFGNKIFILYKNKLEEVNLRGKTKEEIVLNELVEKILLAGEKIILYGDKNIIIPGKNRNSLNFKTKEDIVDLKYNDENLLIQKKGKLEIYKLKEKGEN